MGFFEDDPTLITSQFLYRAAVVIALLRWVLFCIIRFRNRNSSSPSSSSSSQQQQQQQQQQPPSSSTCSISSQMIKERLVLASFGDIKVRMPWVPDTCAVCLNHMEEDDLVRELRNCCHVFHRECIDRWVDYDHHKTCPLCRAPLLTYLQSKSLNNWPKNEPNWAVERILYIFGDDLVV
ncbi:hypothetical protein WN944_002474 [Citrus x changshan-huyou]|uniref:RING-type domain-containing protein n=3 Tax=Citrus TaxID=2706 RepID=A0ACB8P4T0_CITSI|nr:RING-H2 finger protein ATL39 [Citrus x clementina]ESR66170.1 hypothetical protein CICLE_v10009663mg [Citrus x clementina]KAH9804928.1 RING-type domain-containing protein [Citrus sinensis]